MSLNSILIFLTNATFIVSGPNMKEIHTSEQRNSKSPVFHLLHTPAQSPRLWSVSLGSWDWGQSQFDKTEILITRNDSYTGRFRLIPAFRFESAIRGTCGWNAKTMLFRTCCSSLAERIPKLLSVQKKHFHFDYSPLVLSPCHCLFSLESGDFQREGGGRWMREVGQGGGGGGPVGCRPIQMPQGGEWCHFDMI